MSPAPVSASAGKKATEDVADKAKSAESQNVPRSIVGTVTDSGEIVDQDGNTIGRVAEPKAGKDLAGSSVNATGQVVGESGDTLGEAKLEESTGNGSGEYTTVSKDEASQGAQEGKEGESSSGWFGKTKGMFNAASSAGQALGGKGEEAKEQAEGAKDAAQGQAESASGDAQGKTGEVKDAVDDKTQGASESTPQQETSESDQLKDASKPDTQQAQDAEQEAGEKAEQTESDTKAAAGTGEEPEAADVTDKTQEAQDTAGEAAENTQDEAKDKAEDVAEGAEAAEKSQEGGVKETAEGAEDKADEAAPVQLEDREGDKSEDKPTDEAGDELQKEGVPEQAEGAQAEAGEAKPEEGEAEKAAEDAQEEIPDKDKPIDLSALEGAIVNKAGNLVDKNGAVVGRVADGGDPKQLQGKKCDASGNIYNDSGKIVGRAEPITEGERDDFEKESGAFANFPGAIAQADGSVTYEDKRVGTIVEGDPKKLKGSKVDADGDILDHRGNTVGRAEAWDEPEVEEEAEADRSILNGKRVNKGGFVVDSHGTIFGKVVEGDLKTVRGRMCNAKGEIVSESGEVIGKAELVPESEREGSKEGAFAEIAQDCKVTKEGKIVNSAGVVVGRLIEGNAATLAGRGIDEDGEILDANGNLIGKAERYDEPEEEKKKGPMEGLRVNKSGEVVGEDGDVIGKLVSGDPNVCAGKEIDSDGDVLNSKNQTVGHVSLLADIPAEEETEEQKKEREQAEADRKLAAQLGGAIEQSLDKIRPILKLIKDKIDSAERKPKEELDEEQLVKEVKPLIEEGGKILTETNGMIRGMDPDGRIQRNAKQKSGTKEASPEEHHLAEMLKELTGSVTETVDDAKRKIEGMPHAKKELNPLWGLLMEPLGQILAAVGLLLTGVLGLVGKLLGGLGLGGLVDGLLGGLGLNKVLGSLGLGSAYDALVGKKKK